MSSRHAAPGPGVRCGHLLPLLVTLVVATFVPRSAAAQGTTSASADSAYENAKVAQALAKLHATIDPDPEQKIVEGVDVVPLEEIEDDDPAPSFLNVFHATTRQAILRR